MSKVSPWIAGRELFVRSTKATWALSLLAICNGANAGLSDCSDLYVGSIWVEQGTGLHAVVFLQNAGDASGSYWQYFTQFSADERKSALALLTAAKLANHRVSLATHAAGGCSITVTSQYVKSVYLAHRP